MQSAIASSIFMILVILHVLVPSGLYAKTPQLGNPIDELERAIKTGAPLPECYTIVKYFALLQKEGRQEEVTQNVQRLLNIDRYCFGILSMYFLYNNTSHAVTTFLYNFQPSYGKRSTDTRYIEFFKGILLEDLQAKEWFPASKIEKLELLRENEYAQLLEAWNARKANTNIVVDPSKLKEFGRYMYAYRQGITLEETMKIQQGEKRPTGLELRSLWLIRSDWLEFQED